jgi:hypothetical protein
MSKIGRNDPCPCNSGKKYKKCHGGMTTFPAPLPVLPPAAPQFRVTKIESHPIPPDIARKFAEQQRKDLEFTRQFGHVRPPIAMDVNGYKLVIAGGGIVWQPTDKAKYFTDILLNFFQNIFGREWSEAEFAKPRGERHPVIELRYKALSYMNKQERTPDGIYISQMTGPMQAYFGFAYDLWVVNDTARLDKHLVERLKNHNLFHGARHELFAEATCIRAGFDIEHEDESDRSTRHAEFTATHRVTRQKISVEAKSKHRSGVMGQPGARAQEGKYDMPIGKLLNDAIDKRPPHPLVVFLDLNLPWKTAAPLLSMEPPHPFIHKTLDRIRKRNGGKDPISFLVTTNHPEHYLEDEELATSHQILTMLSNVSDTPDLMRETLQAIHRAAMMYGNIPQHFENSGKSAG